MTVETPDAAAESRRRKLRRPRLSAEARKHQLTEATIKCLALRPPQDWTLRQVSRDIGVAPSLITYFFATWDDLLLSAYRLMVSRVEADLDAIAAGDGDPASRMEAAIDYYLTGEDSAHGADGAYIAFWAFGRRDQRLHALMADFSLQMLDRFHPMLEAYAEAKGQARPTREGTEALLILLDGLWYQLTVNPAFMSLDKARAHARAFLEHSPPAR